MSFLPSLLLYNPLEAFIILLFCNVCSGTKTKIRIILDSYILGTLNFVVQYPNMFLENPMWQLIYNVFVVLIIMPLIAYLYCRKKFRFSYKICTFANLFILSTGMIIAWVSNTFITTIITNEFENGCYEMIFNLVLRALSCY